ncbi:MAG: peptidylprolyl isomerase [Pseudomonadota bacterium]
MDRLESMGARAARRRLGQAALLLVAAGTAGLAGCAPGEPGMEVPASAIDRTDDPVVARVDGTPIHRSDVRRAAEGQGLIGPDEPLETGGSVFAYALDGLIDQRLLARDAVASGVGQDIEVRRRLASARERILGNYRVEALLKDTVTDAAVQDLYLAQSELAGEGEERLVRRIVVADQALADRIARQLADEEDFGTLAEVYSTDEGTAGRGGEMGWIGRDALADPLAAAVFDASVGGRTPPVEMDGSWHIVEVVDTRVPSARTFEDTREELERFMTFETVEALLTELRDTARIERLYDAPGDPVEPSESAPGAAADPEDGGDGAP